MSNEKKRILMVSSLYPTPELPQYGIFVHKTVKALQAMGSTIMVYCPQRQYGKSSSSVNIIFDGVEVCYHTYSCIPSRYFMFLAHYFYARDLRKYIENGSFDIIHAHSTLPEGAAVRLVAKELGIPFFVHEHGLDVFSDHYISPKLFSLPNVHLAKKVQKDARCVFGVSGRVTEEINRGNPSAITDVVYNGVDNNVFFSSRFKLSAKLPQIISVGNLIPLKGHRYLLDALALVREKAGYRLHCEILGRGVLESDLKAQVQQLNLESQVVFSGYLPEKEVARRMNDADIFVLPSDYEALGCVYLEAMACGLIAIGCSGQGIAEIIRHGENGGIVPPRSPEALAQVLLDIIKFPDKWRKVSENGMTTARCMTWETGGSIISTYYNESLRNKYEKG